ncbi:metal-dependent hydrolase [Thermoflavimicrobium dichotomicum]|uniref:Inner membrane protein n=1 Tax=Thermoflavimicrobium dichotomicum TaxID=46223 RepID=A0A1I3KJK8_9BACL|nr:metal-dependent hydrolase [Thermoflavimicrobium dichotomicum]SFI72385.1 inner membrane protein [Thermoflavimicrobium dichotomicum]
MDTITHGLIGYTLYKIAKKDEMSVAMQRGLLFTALVGSQAPDIDVVVRLTETGRIMEQMWHRGLTHSVFLVPLWALIIYGCTRLWFKVKDRLLLYLAGTSVFIHDTIDLFNPWGTGYLEPFSSIRISIGSIPIIDLVFWAIILTGWIFSRVKKTIHPSKIFRWVAFAMLIHLSIQTIQGLWLEYQVKNQYEKTELVATFVPGVFQIVGKKGERVEILQDSLFTAPEKIKILHSKEKSDLTPLFQKNPRAKVLMQWSPFVVVVDDQERLGIFDPRFYRNGKFFIGEYVHK